jgi:hypothetical protein
MTEPSLWRFGCVWESVQILAHINNRTVCAEPHRATTQRWCFARLAVLGSSLERIGFARFIKKQPDTSAIRVCGKALSNGLKMLKRTLPVVDEDV